MFTFFTVTTATQKANNLRKFRRRCLRGHKNSVEQRIVGLDPALTKAYAIEGKGKMTKLLLAAAAFVLAHPALAQGNGAISATSAETADGFADFRECQAALNRSADAAATGAAAIPGGSATASGSIVNRALGNISRCTKVDGEYLIVVYPAGSRTGPDA